MKEKILQKFECVVTDEIDDKGLFWIEMHDLTDKTRPIEIAELRASAMPIDANQIKEGTIFYWDIIELEDPLSGKKVTCNKVIVREDIWTTKMLNKAHKLAKKLFKQFAEHISQE